MPGMDEPLIDELGGAIGVHKLRIQQQRIHATELSADPTQQKHAEAQLAAMAVEFRRRLVLKKRAMRRARPSSRNSMRFDPQQSSFHLDERR